MKHQERTNIKRAAYIAAGYDCSKIFSTESESYFLSERNGLKRKHIFTNTSVNVEIIKDEPIVEVVPEIVEPVQQEEKPKKKTTRKKKGT